MSSYHEFVRFCQGRSCEKGGLYAIQPVGLAGAPIKIGYAYNLLQRLAAWHYAYPQGIKILAVARMNRPNDTHFGKRRVLQLAEAALKYELRVLFSRETSGCTRVRRARYSKRCGDCSARSAPT